MFLISDLCAELENYLESDQVAEIYRAYLFGAEAHEGQRRKSGEPYIYHPLAVARILADLHLDHQTLIAAILHDVIEDTPVSKQQLSDEFGSEVAELVDGVSKLTHIEFENRAVAQAENFRKMMLAMVRDIRVILIKLADRLHNMRTLGVMRPDKRRRIARETLDIYVPIALRLGLNTIRHELEELGFVAYYPMRARALKAVVKKVSGHRKEIVAKLEANIHERLKAEGMSFKVKGRKKHLYSIYRKMRDKHISFTEVMDVFGFRIIVDSVDSCYRVLGAVHNLYKPIPGKFKDYIAIPKANGYQSLHTALLSPYGVPLEVQIRTKDMEKVAEAGIAAHWLYKSGSENGSIAQARAREWLSSLLEMQKHAGDSLEFLENVKVDLFPDEVYLFTPKGEILELPRGATPIDFAYAVHTDVGNRCVAAKVNRRLVPLNSKLFNGASVEILTSPVARPNPAWLNFVVTAKARTTIRHYLKQLQRGESIELGQRMLEKALSDSGLSFEELRGERLVWLLSHYNLERVEDLFADIGLGNRMATLVTNTLIAEDTTLEPPARSEGSGPLYIRGTEGTVVNFAGCCHPIPGDAIIGFLSAGRGIVIHTQNCNNTADFRRRPEKWLEVQWEKGVSGNFPVELKIDVLNQRGVLATIAAAIAETDANIDNVAIHERDGSHTEINLTIAVNNRAHLARIMQQLRNIDEVSLITRVKG